MSGRAVPARTGKRRDVHDRALGLLAVRQRSRAELQRRLVGAGFGADEVAGELRRLEGVGLIDDRAFARAVVDQAVGARGEGRRAVARRLSAAGVAPAIRDEVLEDLPADRELERAVALAEARAPRLLDVPPERAFSRLCGFLARRGFSPEVVRSAARRALALEALGE